MCEKKINRKRQRERKRDRQTEKEIETTRDREYRDRETERQGQREYLSKNRIIKLIYQTIFAKLYSFTRRTWCSG